ncbi:acyl carrier protein [Amycolatopsis sp. NPDC049691]|uniref:acyl carrier protein n=1 Tax=Amycolatopsis sp. NPDC049691 TaxID=3155155 RepID=UPI00343C15E3
METTVNARLVQLLADKAELPVDELGPDRTLEEIGLDSLHLMEVALWVQREYGAIVPEGDLHHDLTVREALSYLDEKTAAVR